MKLLAVYLSIFLFATFGILPVMLYAGEKEIDGKPVRILSIESIPAMTKNGRVNK